MSTACRAFGVINANVARSPHISLSAKALYALLATYADETGACWPSNSTLAEGLGVTERTVKTLLGELVEKRVITRESRFVEGRQTTSLTTLIEIRTPGRGGPYPPPEGGEADTRGGDASDTLGGDAGFTQNKTSRNNNPPKPPQGGAETKKRAARPSAAALRAEREADPAFAEFYDLYPRHAARGDAYKAWRQVTCNAVPPRDPSCIMAGLRQQVPHLTAQKAEGYCPLPASWLRHERWEDEVTPRREPKPDPNENMFKGFL